MGIIEGARQALVTSKCSCNGISANLEYGEKFTCSKCEATWHARYKGHSPTLTLKEQ